MKPTNPKLWQESKDRARATSEGSPKGRWGARKAALARLDYRDRGGKWNEPTTREKQIRAAALRKARRSK